MRTGTRLQIVYRHSRTQHVGTVVWWEKQQDGGERMAVLMDRTGEEVAMGRGARYWYTRPHHQQVNVRKAPR